MVWAAVATAGVSTLLGANERAKQNQLQQEIDEYNKTVNDINTAMTLNDIAMQEQDLKDKSVETQLQIGVQQAQEESSLAVQAEASGLAGGSLSALERGISKDAASANFQNQQQLESQLTVLDQQSEQAQLQNINTLYASDYQESALNPASLITDFGTSFINSYGSDQLASDLDSLFV